MDCPVCTNTKLVMSERQGIEIDYCPNCRGVWLDRGELDKIIERSIGTGAQVAPQASRNDTYQNQAPRSNYPHPQQSHSHYKKKREGFLSDLFDFD